MEIEVTLSQNSLIHIRKIAANRHEAKALYIKNKGILTKPTKQTRLNEFLLHWTHKPHFIGLTGEFTYAYLTSQDIDLKIYDLRDTGFDVGRAEVKTSTWNGNDIELKIKKTEFYSKNPDLYVLMRSIEDKFETVYENIVRFNKIREEVVSKWPRTHIQMIVTEDKKK